MDNNMSEIHSNGGIKNIGFFLGTFDPIHLGHVNAILTALTDPNYKLDEVIIVPCYRNPWKTIPTPYFHRVNMCKAVADEINKIMPEKRDDIITAMKDYPVSVSTIEIDMGNKTHYSNEVLKVLKEKYGKNATLSILCGTDVCKSIRNWMESDWIMKNFNIYNVHRPESPKDADGGISLSSTSIRNLILKGEDPSPFIMPCVKDYIKKWFLYKDESVYEKAFSVVRVTNELVAWISDWFNKNGYNCNAIIGISGGKDSTIMASLLTLALGPSRVYGVAMPDNHQGVNDADKICEYLGINYMKVDIGGMVDDVCIGLNKNISLLPRSVQNIPPRIRMTVLYAIAQSLNGRVIGTCNLSENYIGYFTKHGDGASDVEPLANLTVTELLQIGDYLGLPYEWVHRTPDDGLPHSHPDEEKFGFSYATLDKFIRNGAFGIPDDIAKKIRTMHIDNMFKLKPVDTFNPFKIEY